MTDVSAASSTDRWWLQDQYRDQFDAGSREGGQMAPRTWENRPDEGERFKKFLAGLNPLQHIPGVNLVYRELTGEKLEPGQQILGGALFGGVFGLVAGLFNAAVTSSSAAGKDIAGSIMGIFDSGETPAKQTAAAVAPAAAAAPAATAAAPAQPRAPGAAFTAEGQLPDVLDLDAIAPAAGGNTPAPAAAPLNKPVAATATSTAPITLAATNDRHWFPARGRENVRGSLVNPPPTSPMVMSMQNAQADGRVKLGQPLAPGMLPGAGQIPPAAGQIPPVSNRAGVEAYGSALELSRELQRHYLGAQPAVQ